MNGILKKLLLDIVDRIDSDNSSLSEDDTIKLVEVIKRYTDKEREVSKYEACQIVGLKRAQFDNMVRAGKIPRGHHKIGFKELRWYIKDLETFNKNRNETL